MSERTREDEGPRRDGDSADQERRRTSLPNRPQSIAERFGAAARERAHLAVSDREGE